MTDDPRFIFGVLLAAYWLASAIYSVAGPLPRPWLLSVECAVYGFLLVGAVLPRSWPEAAMYAMVCAFIFLMGKGCGTDLARRRNQT